MDLNHESSILSIVFYDQVWCLKVCLGMVIVFTSTLLSRVLVHDYV